LSVFDKALGIARRAKAFLKRSRGDVARGDAAANAERREERSRNRKRARQLTSEHKKRLRSEIRSKKRELKRIRQEGFDGVENRAARIERKRGKKTAQQEIFELERELRFAKERTAGEPLTGALPDFVVIGTAKGGTSYFYHLLTQHPYVEPAAAKELHFFGSHFDEGVEWYRRCFPASRWKEGRKTITGEATPYLGNPNVPERMARVIPRARLIALLRNPVDRAYSMYHHRVRHGWETRTFEEAIEAEEARMLEARRDESAIRDEGSSYLRRGVYVDQLLRWTKFFSDDQMLILKSEDFFERPQNTLRLALEFLGLPNWEFEASEVVPKKRNKGSYEDQMNPATRRRLEEYFEPHNRRLYDFLGVDFGW
jgi:Sulfotransferase domain